MTTPHIILPRLLSPIERSKRLSAQRARSALPITLPRLRPHTLHRHGPEKLEVLDGQRAEKRLHRRGRFAERREHVDGLGELLGDELAVREGLEKRFAGGHGLGDDGDGVGRVLGGVVEERRGNGGVQMGQFGAGERLLERGELLIAMAELCVERLAVRAGRQLGGLVVDEVGERGVDALAERLQAIGEIAQNTGGGGGAERPGLFSVPRVQRRVQLHLFTSRW